VTGASGLVLVLAFWSIWVAVDGWAIRHHRPEVDSIAVLAAVAWVVGRAAWWAAHRQWAAALAEIVAGVIWFSIWRRNRKGRDRAAKLVGGKARAIRDKLLRRQREAARPGRPVTERI
jgi:hypothetical protein